MTGRARAGTLTALNGIVVCLLICAGGLYYSMAAGAVHAALLALLAVYMKWRWSGHGGKPDARRVVWELASLVALLVFVVDLFVLSRNLIGAALRLLLFIVAYHADNPQSARRARQTLGLSLIQMIAASASTTEIAFFFVMAAYLVAALWTLTALGAAEREAPPARSLRPSSPAAGLRLPILRLVGAASPAVGALALGIFFVIPHYGTGYFRQAGAPLRQSISGFSETIQLGDIGSLKKNHSTVMKLQKVGVTGPPPLPLRMRGLAFDRYDGRTWSITDKDSFQLLPESGDMYVIDPDGRPTGREANRHSDPNWLVLDILMEPLKTRVLFTPPGLVSLSARRFHSLYRNLEDSLFSDRPALRPFFYRTASLRPPRDRREDPSRASWTGRADYLQLPELDPRVVALARSIAPGVTDPLAIARAVQAHLLRHYTYSLDVNDDVREPPLTRFLIEHAPGHCEYFATAMAILLRVRNVPSRIVNGFYGGEYSELTDQTIIRQSDAHSWVEAKIPGRGWLTFDPTPPDPGLTASGLLARLRRLKEEAEIAWDTYIVGLDLGDQQNALAEIQDRFELTIAGAAIRLRGAVEMLRRLARGPGSLLRLAGLAAAGLAFMGLLAGLLAGAARAWTLRPGAARVHPASRLFRRFERAVRGRTGPRRDPSISPAAFAREAGAGEVAEAFEAARYGPEAVSRQALGRLRRAIQAFGPSRG